MPRYYRRRYTRVVKPKKKWASNIMVWNNESLSGSYAAILVTNSVQSGTPTPSILKVGNFKISADLNYRLSGTETDFNAAVIAYILYIPEGWENTAVAYDNLITKHPEWIMATKTMGVGYTNTSSSHYNESLNVSTRLKRNLNSGDQVVLYIHINRPGSLGISAANLTGTCRYWTCAN